MRWPFLVLGAIVASAAGCRNCDLVEAELRSRENEVRELRDELNRVESFNEALRQEAVALRHSGAPSCKLSPECASQAFTVKEICLGRLTGGYDEDNCRGDQALQVVVEPRDQDGHTIKAPGRLSIEALEITSEGLKVPLSSWEMSFDQVRRSWRNGFLLNGYVLVVPWKVLPSCNKIRVVARFTLPDDRVFEADRDITIRLPVDHHQPANAPGDPILEEQAPLPSPRQVPLPPTTEGSGAPAEPGNSSNAVRPAGLWQRRGLAGAVQVLGPSPGLEDWRR
jgi:hypothetical protein